MFKKKFKENFLAIFKDNIHLKNLKLIFQILQNEKNHLNFISKTKRNLHLLIGKSMFI